MNRALGLLLAIALAVACESPASPSSSPSATSSPSPTAAAVASATPRPPGSTFVPFALERDGEGIVLEAVAVPAGRYRYDWTATGECEYDVKLGKRVAGQAAPSWLVEISMQAGRGSGGGEFELPEPAEILELSGTGCRFTLRLEQA